MVINKSTSDLTAPLHIAGLDDDTVARVFRYGQADPTAIVALPDQPIARAGTTIGFPAYSITEFVLPAS